MKLLLGLIGGLVVGIVGTFLVLTPKDVSFGFAEFNTLYDPTFNSTTTGSFASTVPVKVLENVSGRKYARIINDDATNDVYIYITNDTLCYNFTELASGCDRAATNTPLTTYRGIRLENAGGYYEITPDNQFTGEVWATSTNAVGLKVITIER